MRYLFGFLCVCALVGTSPLSVSAQAGEEGATSEPGLEEPAPEEPALQLKLDAAGVDVVPSPPRTADGYTLEEMERRVMLAKLGVGVSAVPIFVGALLAASTAFSPLEPRTPEEQTSDRRLQYTGVALAAGGAASMVAMGIVLGVRKRKLRSLQDADYGGPRRVQWDLAQSHIAWSIERPAVFSPVCTEASKTGLRTRANRLRLGLQKIGAVDMQNVAIPSQQIPERMLQSPHAMSP
jgi:hypothetical protein